jgi:hypothetical protein
MVERPADRSTRFDQVICSRFNRHQVKTSADRSTPIDQDGHTIIHPTIIRFKPSSGGNIS